MPHTPGLGSVSVGQRPLEDHYRMGEGTGAGGGAGGGSSPKCVMEVDGLVKDSAPGA